ncbi:MAG TPA: signal peptidase II [Byssovorax sp.]|jgi:signal peptidase II
MGDESAMGPGAAPTDPNAAPLVDVVPSDLPALDAAQLGDLPPAPPPLGVEVPPPSIPKPPSTRFLVIVAGISVALDLGTKLWAKETLAGADRHARLAKRFHVIPDHMDFIFAQNPGGAWSFLRSLPDSLRRPFFLVVSAAAIVFIITIYRRIRPEQWAMRWGLPLALGGALGNLVDRIRYGWVVDFVDVFVKHGDSEHHWPTFNVADIAIVFGVLLMAFEMLRPRRSQLLALTTRAPQPEPSPFASQPQP